MKKLAVWLLCLLVLCLGSTALAATYRPGQDVTITVKITSNSGNATNGSILVNAANDSVLIFKSSKLTMGGLAMSFPPQVDGASFSLSSSDLVTPIAPGVVGTVTYHISESAPDGEYKISVSSAKFGVSGGMTVVVKGCEHEWGSWEVTKAPTCAEVGTKERVCTLCGAKETGDIETIDHTWGDWVVDTEPTCDMNGTEVCTCTVCGAEDARPIPSEGHKWGDWVVTGEPTCQMVGQQERECTVCGAGDAMPIDKIPHDWTEWTVATAATCTKDGLETRTCNAGNHTEERVIDALGHAASTDAVRVDPTCTKDGSISYKCTRCGVDVSGETIPKLGHDWGEWAVTTEPTCGKAGEQTRTCGRCGEVETQSVPKLKNHVYSEEGVVTKEPTCTKDGTMSYYCIYDCGKARTETIDKLGHNPSDDAVRVEPTCTEDGSISYNCTRCGKQISGEKLPKLGHDWTEWNVTKEPTCTKAGEQTRTCNRCNKVETKTVKATGTHIYSEEGTVTKEPTCTKAGTMSYKCIYDGCTKARTETIAKLGHDWDEGVVTKEPTCTKTGVKTVTCKRDPSHTQTEKVPALGHAKSDDAVIVPATCTKDGSVSYVCAVCGTKISGEKIPKLGHDWDDGVVTTPKSCTTNGVKTYTCKNDPSHTKTEIIKKGHDWQYNYDDGTKICEGCGNVSPIKVNATYRMYVCTEGLRFRDLENVNIDDWYMFTPVDLSVDGEQTFNLVAGNCHVIGTATLVVKEGNVTVDYTLNNKQKMHKMKEFVTFLPSASELTGVDYDALTNYGFGKEISIEEDLGGDTKVLLVMRNLVGYNEGIYGIKTFRENGEYVETLKQLMD